MGQGLADMGFVTTVLGSSGIFATPERAASGYLVEFGETRLWMDAGAGTWRHLLSNIAYPDLDAVILSHRHPDHVTDVFQAYHARQYGGPEPLARIPLWAPQETLESITAYLGELDSSFDLCAVKGGDSIDYAGATISFFSMAHSAETVGIRIEYDGGTLAYSADTGPDGELQGLAARADVFLCEATFQDSDGGWMGHMSASQAGAATAEAGAAKLVLTHLRPGRDFALSLAEAQRTCGGAQVQLAVDGQRLEIAQ
ncbi:MAG: MBL fold metallo-hydrolase [Actinomycetota bacterium]|nr:MBL fold metallo-hydrolase [Actinomycetota bacterium]